MLGLNSLGLLGNHCVAFEPPGGPLSVVGPVGDTFSKPSGVQGKLVLPDHDAPTRRAGNCLVVVSLALLGV